MSDIRMLRQSQIQNKCEICDKEFKNNNGLKKHFNNIHGNSEKEHQCNICQKLFDIQSQLTNHVKNVHANRRHYKCDSC